MIERKFSLKKKAAWLSWLTSGELPVSAKRFANVSVAGAIVIFTLSLYTNQEFHNGVWGPLHNKSVKPKIEISDAQIENNSLSFSVYRVEGVDVYGSFLIGISLKNADGDIVLEKKGEELADFPIGNIDNKYIARVAPGKHSLVIPLGSKATLTVDDTAIGSLPKGKYELVLTDISGITWKKEIIH